jgi:hypothetical protein
LLAALDGVSPVRSRAASAGTGTSGDRAAGLAGSVTAAARDVSAPAAFFGAGAALVDGAASGAVTGSLPPSDGLVGPAPLVAWAPGTGSASCFGLVDALVRLPLLRTIDGTFRG